MGRVRDRDWGSPKVNARKLSLDRGLKNMGIVEVE